MKAPVENRRPRVVHYDGTTYLLIARAANSKLPLAELGSARYVADAYRLQAEPGTRASLLLVTTGRASSTANTALDYASEQLRAQLRIPAQT